MSDWMFDWVCWFIAKSAVYGLILVLVLLLYREDWLLAAMLAWGLFWVSIYAKAKQSQ